MTLKMHVHSYVLHSVIDGIPCSIQVAVKPGPFTGSPPGGVKVFRDAAQMETFDALLEPELLAEATWTGAALTDRQGRLSERGFDEVEAVLRAHLAAKIREAFGTPTDRSKN
jgi:hypothetical protein